MKKLLEKSVIIPFNNYFLLLIAWIIFIIILVLVLINTNIKKEPPILLEVNIINQNPYNYDLRINLKNKENSIYLFFGSLLPWNNYNAFQILIIPFIFENNENVITYDKKIKQNFLIEDPNSSISIFWPKSSIEGYITLDERFPTLREILKDKNVLICWNYTFPAYNKEYIIPFENYLLIQINNRKNIINNELKIHFREKCLITFKG